MVEGVILFVISYRGVQEKEIKIISTWLWDFFFLIAYSLLTSNLIIFGTKVSYAS